MRPERAENDARPGAAGRASHQQESQGSSGSTLVRDTVAPVATSGNGATSRIDPDTKGVQWTVVVLVGLLGLTSFIVSFRALHDVAAWAGIGPGLQWAVPVFVDGAILTYALAVLVHRSRGEPVWPSWTSLGVFTAMSVAANAAHAVAVPQEQWWQTLTGAVLAALAPLGVFAATEQMARLVVLRPQDRQVPGPVLEPAAEVESLPATTPASANVAGIAPATEPWPSTPQPEPVVELAEPEPEERHDSAPEPVTKEMTAPIAERVADSAADPDPQTSPGVVEQAAEERADEDFVAWVQERRRQGDPITGPTAGAFLGVSERTGRNRIKELRTSRPELFEEDAA